MDMMKRACQSKQFAELDHAIKTKVEPFLYNKGLGKWFPIPSIVLLRNRDHLDTVNCLKFESLRIRMMISISINTVQRCRRPSIMPTWTGIGTSAGISRSGVR